MNIQDWQKKLHEAVMQKQYNLYPKVMLDNLLRPHDGTVEQFKRKAKVYFAAYKTVIFPNADGIEPTPRSLLMLIDAIEDEAKPVEDAEIIVEKKQEIASKDAKDELKPAKSASKVA